MTNRATGRTLQRYFESARPASSATLSSYTTSRDATSPDGSDRREAAMANRLDQIDRRLARSERDVGIAIETLAIFIRFWLATTPALPEPAA